MSDSEPPSCKDSTFDTGLLALVYLLAIHRIAGDPAQFRHDLGHANPSTTTDLLRLAKRIEGVRARSIQANWAKLQRLPLPAIAMGRDGTFFLIVQVRAGEILNQDPLSQSPEKLARSAFEER